MLLSDHDPLCACFRRRHRRQYETTVEVIPARIHISPASLERPGTSEEALPPLYTALLESEEEA
ncbi:hypothetical protein KCP75_15015 [Salmonella enterica subsp. enterica]|nr:hypothetical protein KCP75_15015 [Salmonella enterica subsp. enterica]